jgi:hypothetical protein
MLISLSTVCPQFFCLNGERSLLLVEEACGMDFSV